MYSDMMCRLAARVMIVELDARVNFDPKRNLCCTDRGSKDKCERLIFPPQRLHEDWKLSV